MTNSELIIRQNELLEMVDKLIERKTVKIKESEVNKIHDNKS